jgi:predicted peptidase
MMRLIFMVLLCLPVAAADTGMMTKKHKNADGSESPYDIFIPPDYDGTKLFPVILFLHGSGETKGGKQQPVEVGLGPVVKSKSKDFPYIVIFPQSEKRTWLAESDDGKRAVAILDSVIKSYRVDKKRQILTGLSMGGFGTWSHAAAAPDRWAAIVPICGGVQPKTADDVAKKIKDIPCWCFHGDSDPAVNIDKSREIIAALKKAGGSPKFTQYVNVGHNCWDKAYSEEDLWTWLAKQKR